ncbi:DUF5753 domain-containing protein, partial [Nocardia wallacei]
WWHRYSDLLPQWFETYIGLEHAAHSIRTFEAQLVPGLLQTEAYTRAVVELGHEEGEAARRVELRLRRQEVLDRPGAPTLWAIVDETVLHRPVGGNAVLREQLEHLVEMSERPNVTLQVLPYAAGGHAAVGSSFAVLRFAEQELPDIVYIEQLTSALYLDSSKDLDLYRRVMDRLSIQADPPEKSRQLMKAAAARL